MDKLCGPKAEGLNSILGGDLGSHTPQLSQCPTISGHPWVHWSPQATMKTQYSEKKKKESQKEIKYFRV